MPNQQLYLKSWIYDKLRKEENMSFLVNKLLKEHYDSEDPIEKANNEKAIIEETKANMKESEERDKIKAFLKDHDYKAYEKGLKAKKWKSVNEYARIKLKL